MYKACFLLQEAYKLLTKYNAVTEEETKSVSDLRNVFVELQSKAVSTFATLIILFHSLFRNPAVTSTL